MDFLSVLGIIPEIRIQSQLLFFLELYFTSFDVKDTSLSHPAGLEVLLIDQWSWLCELNIQSIIN